MAEKIIVLGLIMFFPPYLRYAMVWFPLMNQLMTKVFVEQPLASPGSANYLKDSTDSKDSKD